MPRRDVSGSLIDSEGPPCSCVFRPPLFPLHFPHRSPKRNLLRLPALMPLLQSLLAISLGASLGAMLRWLLGLGLNNLFPALPMGTLLANLLGGYLIGLSIAWFAHHPDLPVAWRLLVITGFLGGLTTFSTFSAEVIALLQQGRALLAVSAIVLHVAGSLLMTLLGLATASWLKLGR